MEEERCRARRHGRHAGSAPGAPRPSWNKHNALEKVLPRRSWKGESLFSHPGLLLSFQRETVARLFSLAASSPPLPAPGLRPGSLALNPGLGQREPALPGARSRGLLPGRALTLPHALARAREPAARPLRSEDQLGGIGASEAASRREDRGGGGRGASWNFLPQGFGSLGTG